MGILTHLDKFTSMKTLRQTKKRMKARFWTEVYDGAKLFYLSGLKYNAYTKVCEGQIHHYTCWSIIFHYREE